MRKPTPTTHHRKTRKCTELLRVLLWNSVVGSPLYAAGFTLLCLLLFWDAEASAADLLNIRFGWHSTFARVVFDFDGKVAYKIEGDRTRGNICLEFFGASLSELSQIDLGKLDGEIIGSLHVQKRGESHITAEITPKGNYTVSAFHLSEGALGKENPFKVVVDVYGNPITDDTDGTPDGTGALLTPVADGERGESVRSAVPKSEPLSLRFSRGKVQVGQPEEHITKIKPPHHSGESEKIRGDPRQQTLSTILHYIRGDLKAALGITILCALVLLVYQFERKRSKGRSGASGRAGEGRSPPLTHSPPPPVGEEGAWGKEGRQINLEDRMEPSRGDQPKDILFKEKKYELAGQLAAGGWRVQDIAKELQMGQREVELVESLAPRARDRVKIKMTKT